MFDSLQPLTHPQASTPSYLRHAKPARSCNNPQGPQSANASVELTSALPRLREGHGNAQKPKHQCTKTQTHHPPMFAQNRHALLQHAPAARSYRASHGCGFWCLALARMPFRPDFPAVAASRPVAVTGRAQTECKADGTTGGLRSAEEMASEEFGPTWLTEAFHAAWALA